MTPRVSDVPGRGIDDWVPHRVDPRVLNGSPPSTHRHAMDQEKVLKMQALTPAEYLIGDEVIDLPHPSIKRFAGSLRAEHVDDLSFARAAFEYARDGVRHSWDVQGPRVTLSASQTLREGVGLCFAKAHLLTGPCSGPKASLPDCAISGSPTTAPPSMCMGSLLFTCRAVGTDRTHVATSPASTRSSRSPPSSLRGPWQPSWANRTTPNCWSAPISMSSRSCGESLTFLRSAAGACPRT
jgi:hypothetical protein